MKIHPLLREGTLSRKLISLIGISVASRIFGVKAVTKFMLLQEAFVLLRKVRALRSVKKSKPI